MQLKSYIPAVLVFFGAAAVTHLAVLYQQPRIATDKTLAAIRERGAQWNYFSVGTVRDAKSNVVVRDNPDTITGFAMLDLKEGPALFTMPALREPLYWSVSVYGRNTDTLGVVRDDQGLEEVRIAIALKNQPIPDGYQRIEAESSVAAMIVRAIVRDRNDPEAVAAIRQELLEADLHIEP